MATQVQLFTEDATADSYRDGKLVSSLKGRPYCGKRFFTMNLAEQERHLGSFIPVD